MKTQQTIIMPWLISQHKHQTSICKTVLRLDANLAHFHSHFITHAAASAATAAVAAVVAVIIIILYSIQL